jgi:hypothetical protein
MAINLFEDGTPKEPGNNLIRVRVLQCIDFYNNRALHQDVLRDVGSLGYTDERIEQVLRLFHDQGLIEAGDHSEILALIGGRPFCHQLTSIGKFYLEHLIYEYRYALAIKEDTFFPFLYYSQIIGSGTATGRLEQRQSEVEAFHEYIADMELQEEQRCNDPALLQHVFPRIAEDLQNEYREAIKRLRGRRGRLPS